MFRNGRMIGGRTWAVVICASAAVSWPRSAAVASVAVSLAACSAATASLRLRTSFCRRPLYSCNCALYRCDCP